jgi:hypothetical protein
VRRSPRQGRLGRPSLDGDRLVFDVADGSTTSIVEVDLRTGRPLELRREQRIAVSNPSLLGDALLYVETTAFSQSLVLGRRVGRRGRALLRIAPAITADKGFNTDHGPHRRLVQPTRPRKTGPRGSTTTLWTTALGAGAAYVTRLRQSGGRTTAVVLQVPRSAR